MTCRHGPNDPNCSSHPSNPHNPANIRAKREAEARQQEVARAEAQIANLLARTPNPEQYDVIEAEEVGNHLVLMVKYSSCQACSFDARKVMVFANTNLKQAIKWTRIDPHFSERKDASVNEAPSPVARFPADAAGWKNALRFAEKLLQGEI